MALALVNATQPSSSDAHKSRQFDQVEEHVKGLKVHAMISSDLVVNGKDGLRVPLCEASDEQILAEIARRKLDVHSNITQDLVRSYYEFDSRPIGHGKFLV